MDVSVSASVYPDLPGAVRLVVSGTPGAAGSIMRVDGRHEPQPVRNFAAFDPSGAAVVIDCEAPLGRPVSYMLVDGSGAWLASSAKVTVPGLPDKRALLRSVLRPSVKWMACEPQDEAGVTWETSTSVHRVEGSDTPVIVGEVRQRRSGTITFLCRSVAEADELVTIMRDGTPLLLRVDPCAQTQVRDLLFYALDVTEARWQRRGWRLVAVDYQSTGFVGGDTVEPPAQWTYADVAAEFATYADVALTYRAYWDLMLDERKA